MVKNNWADCKLGKSIEEQMKLTLTCPKLDEKGRLKVKGVCQSNFPTNI